MAKTAKAKFMAIGILAIGLMFSFTVFARAQDAQVGVNSETSGGAGIEGIKTETKANGTGIAFPIPELGNCADKQACKSYCNSSDHIPACIEFGKRHGLMNTDEASRAEKFSKRLQASGGPGGCASADACLAFCSSIEHMETCIKFAEEHGIKNERIEQGKKVSAYLKSGGTMPGKCASEETCKTYCEDFSHAEECLIFAKKIGIIKNTNAPIEKFLELVKNGGGPGGCVSKERCEAYCTDASHADECVAFAEKAGFVDRGQAEKLREDRGNGPGRCDSPKACQDYCTDETHHEECFKFAEERGFIKSGEGERMRDGFVKVRAGLENAPEEVRTCLASVVGERDLENIQSGKLVPGPDIGEKIHSCFEKFGRNDRAQEIFKQAPVEIKICIKEKIGEKRMADITSGTESASAEVADTFRVCAQKMAFQKEMRQTDGREGQTFSAEERNRENRMKPQQGIINFLKTAPAKLHPCLKEKLGDNFDKIQSGETTGNIDTSQLKTCFENFRSGGNEERNEEKGSGVIRPDGNALKPKGESSGSDQQPARPKPLPPQGTIGNQKAQECLEAALGTENPQSVNTSQLSDEVKIKIRNCMSGQFGNPSVESRPNQPGEQNLPRENSGERQTNHLNQQGESRNFPRGMMQDMRPDAFEGRPY